MAARLLERERRGQRVAASLRRGEVVRIEQAARPGPGTSTHIYVGEVRRFGELSRAFWAASRRRAPSSRTSSWSSGAG
jgi:hypothetical protein